MFLHTVHVLNLSFTLFRIDTLFVLLMLQAFTAVARCLLIGKRDIHALPQITHSHHHTKVESGCDLRFWN